MLRFDKNFTLIVTNSMPFDINFTPLGRHYTPIDTNFTPFDIKFTPLGRHNTPFDRNLRRLKKLLLLT